MDANPTRPTDLLDAGPGSPITPPDEGDRADRVRRGMDALVEMLTRPTRRKKGHRNPHARRERGMRPAHTKYKKVSLYRRRGVDPAYRRRQQDMLDAACQIDTQIAVGALQVSKRQYTAAVQRRSSELTEARGGW